MSCKELVYLFTKKTKQKKTRNKKKQPKTYKSTAVRLKWGLCLDEITLNSDLWSSNHDKQT